MSQVGLHEVTVKMFGYTEGEFGMTNAPNQHVFRTERGNYSIRRKPMQTRRERVDSAQTVTQARNWTRALTKGHLDSQHWLYFLSTDAVRPAEIFQHFSVFVSDSSLRSILRLYRGNGLLYREPAWVVWLPSVQDCFYDPDVCTLNCVKIGFSHLLS